LKSLRREDLVADEKERMGKKGEPLPRDEQDVTPPHGDELRSEVTFGRTDRYTNLDEEAADRPEADRRRP
jgi:hypothetical protein